ncbi:uncharacterized protein TNCV_4258641 [Trichonephila clavipes]|nr:uncharacterized protein TNCV_4258641 [Trichonephila clavipes]
MPEYMPALQESTPGSSDVSSSETSVVGIQEVVQIKQIAYTDDLKPWIDNFIETKNKTTEGISDMIVSKLKADGLDIVNCKGQAYDNAATMAGCHPGFWQPVLCKVIEAQNYLQTEGLNIHRCAQKIHSLLAVLEAKQEEFVDDALIYAKSLCEEELEISFETPRRIRRKHIFG